MIYFTKHAKKRMRERKIFGSEVQAAISHPDILKEMPKGRKIAVKFVQRKRLEVVFTEKVNKIIIVTAYYAN